MIEPEKFARLQMELTAEFAKYLLDHREVDDALGEDSYVFFQVDGQPEFNAYSQKLAKRREQEEGRSAVCVRLKGLAPPQGSRLIDPVIVPSGNLV